jgi:ATP-dependent DNA helicase RecG
LKLNEISVFGNALLLMRMPHPEIEAMSEHEQSLRSAMQPVYPSTETLTNRGISNRVINKLNSYSKKLKRCLQKPCLII